MNRKQRRSDEKGHNGKKIKLNKFEYLFQVAQQVLESGNYSKAEQLWLELIPRLGNPPGQNKLIFVGCHLGLAEIYRETHRYKEAENHSQCALLFTRQKLGKNHFLTTDSLNGLAWVYFETGRESIAEEYYTHALGITGDGLTAGQRASAATSLMGLAAVDLSKGYYAEAERYYQRSLDIREDIFGQDNRQTAISLYGLTCLYCATGRYTEAEHYIHRVLAIREDAFGPDHHDIAAALNALAEVYISTDRYVEAEKCLLRSQKILGPNDPHFVSVLNSLAIVFRATGRITEAEIYYKSAITECEKAPVPNRLIISCIQNNLAAVCYLTGRYTEAETLYIRSLEFYEKTLGPDNPSTALCLKNLAAVYAATASISAAILMGKLSINIMQKVRLNVSGMGKEVLSTFDTTIAAYYENLAEILIKAERYGEAEYVMGMWKEMELFEMLRRDRQADLPTRVISYNDAEAPLVARFSELGSTLSGAGKQEEALKQIKDRTHEQNQELAAVRIKLKKVNSEFTEFLDNLHDALPPREVSLIDLDSYKLLNLTEANLNTVAVSTITAENGFHTIMVTPHGRKAFSADHKATDIATRVLKFREILKEPADPAYLALSQELYNIIIRPLEGELHSGDYSTILWMLNGVLRLLPLASLHDGKQFMLEKYRNVCITTCSTINQQPHDLWNGLGMGVTLKHGDHDPLPAVKEELEGIISIDNSSGIIPGDILLDEAFTRDAMESYLEAGYKVVHIASHFELNPVNETMSYLLLGDGSKIRMDELRSNPRLFKGVDLVAFSACSTGLGTASTKGREVDGIGYLGEMQGAKTVLATLWPVEDKSTSMLMREFYRLCETGLTKAESLRQAQLRLLNGEFTSEVGYDFTHPYFWAPFILIGNGG